MREVQLSRAELARRLVSWVGLTRLVPSPVAATVRRLGVVQLDPMQVVAPAHLWTLSLRRGPTRLEALDRALRRGELVEAFCGARSLVHVDDAPALVAGWRRRRVHGHGRGPEVDAALVAVLRHAEDGEAFTARSLDLGERVTGFWDPEGVRSTKATSVAVDILWAEGRLAVVGRKGGQKLYRLMAGHLPHVDRLVATLPHEEAEALAVRHSLRVWGVLWSPGALAFGALEGGPARRRWLERAQAEGWAAPVRLAEGPARRLWATPDLLALTPARTGRAALLAPLDNLLWQRERLEALFGFRYRWEAYVPAERRTASAYNMPVLTGARFWGEADARWRDERLEVGLRAASDRAHAVPASVSRAVASAERLAQALRVPAAKRRRGG